jgi:cell wall-associated NlpC family hydrolase
VNRTLAAAIGAVLILVLTLTMGVTLLAGGTANACTRPTTGLTTSGTTATGASATNGLAVSDAQPLGPWDALQTANAALIVTIGTRLGVPPWGQVIALATAIQESGLRNLPYGDRDSLGLFQQRPSQGWGTPAQILDPTYATTRFYQALLAVPGWQSLPLAVAANSVQRSAYPLAYAEHQAQATQLYDHLAPGQAAAGLSIPTGLSARSLSNCAGGKAILARAATWLTAWHGGPVPYSMSISPVDLFHGYRRDCSGYVSMALGLPGPGLDTAALAASATPITKAELQVGDLLINPGPGGAGHVVIFDHWTDPAAMTQYVGYEQSGDGGTHHRLIPYPYFGGDAMFSAYHYWLVGR